MELGIYEQIINRFFKRKLDEMDQCKYYIGKKPIDKSNKSSGKWQRRSPLQSCNTRSSAMSYKVANPLPHYSSNTSHGTMKRCWAVHYMLSDNIAS